MIIYDINKYVQDNLSNEFSNTEIMPMVGYPETTPPFILYHWNSAKRNIERFYLHRDIIIYNVFDNDAERLNKLLKELEMLLNLADLIQGKIPSSDNRVLWSDWRGVTQISPLSREGYYKAIFEFWVGYVPISPASITGGNYVYNIEIGGSTAPAGNVV